MKEKGEVEALARMIDIDASTLVWMSLPPPLIVEPVPIPPRYVFFPLTDDEWEAISPHWATHNQARTDPRDIVNGLLKIASTGCGWRDSPEFATDEALRQQWQRRKKSGVLGKLPELLKGRVGDVRLRQFEQLARW